MSDVITARGLTKRFGETVAVDSLDLAIHPGEVYGLLGPNGAGKTTTLRMLLGLLHPTAGEAVVNGEAPGTSASLARIGALVEEPGLYPYMSGRDNLRVLARMTDTDSRRIDEVLDLVALTDRADDRVRDYSLGMRQRLGVAGALLKDPPLLILDEPTNGLDPQGMAAMRDLIRTLGTGERTVVLSSHLLGEVEAICDRAGVIAKGKLVAEGSVDELRGTSEHVVIRAEPFEDAERTCAAFPGVDAIRHVEDTLEVDLDPAAAPELNAALVGAGVRVHELRTVRRSLEAAFFELTTDDIVDAEVAG